MLLILNGKITFEYQYCQQCGSCLAVCPTKSLSAKRLKNGLVDIQILVSSVKSALNLVLLQ